MSAKKDALVIPCDAGTNNEVVLVERSMDNHDPSKRLLHISDDQGYLGILMTAPRARELAIHILKLVDEWGAK